jgi:hypothetical protein
MEVSQVSPALLEVSKVSPAMGKVVEVSEVSAALGMVMEVSEASEVVMAPLAPEIMARRRLRGRPRWTSWQRRFSPSSAG